MGSMGGGGGGRGGGSLRFSTAQTQYGIIPRVWDIWRGQLPSNLYNINTQISFWSCEYWTLVSWSWNSFAQLLFRFDFFNRECSIRTFFAQFVDSIHLIFFLNGVARSLFLHFQLTASSGCCKRPCDRWFDTRYDPAGIVYEYFGKCWSDLQ